MFEINEGKIATAQKVVLYGVEGVGKSTFASKFPEPLFIDLEGSTNNMNVKRLEPPQSWTVLLQQLDWIKNTKPCKTVVIDTADYAEENLCKPHVVSTRPNANGQFVKNIEAYGYGAGYKHLGEVWGKDFLNKCTEVVDSGINVVIIAHAMQRKVELPDEMGAYDRYELKLEKKTAALTKEWADLLLFMNYKTEVITIKDGMKTTKKGQGQARKMYADHHAAYDAKNRFSLPEEMDLDYKEIAFIFEDQDKVFYKNNEGESVKLDPEKDKDVIKVAEEIKKEFPGSVTEVSEKEAEKEPEEIPFDDFIESGEITPFQVENNQLRQLMNTHKISIEQIEKAVEMKGYFPKGTPINNYPEGFIQSVLVSAFEQVKQQIIDNNL